VTERRGAHENKLCSIGLRSSLLPSLNLTLGPKFADLVRIFGFGEITNKSIVLKWKYVIVVVVANGLLGCAGNNRNGRLRCDLDKKSS
jgi:hypothetical protein